jgi:predicted RecB family nuclease
VTILPGLRGERLAGLQERGIESVEAIPEGYPLTGLQERVRQVTLQGKPWESGSLRAELERVEWPLFYLDFEAAMMAVPRYPGTRPYDPLPFQFSCHIQRSPGAALEHREFLATDPEADPREPLAHALLDVLEERGSIIVYSGYEWRTIQNLAQAVPTLSERLIPLGQRLVDLLAILRNHYYHPAFHGSYSIKQVLPVLAPDMGYEGMEVADGQAAGRAWQQMLASGDHTERVRLAEALRAYCRQDSLAMYRLREALLHEVG